MFNLKAGNGEIILTERLQAILLQDMTAAIENRQRRTGNDPG